MKAYECILCNTIRTKPSDLSKHFLTESHLKNYNNEQRDLIKSTQDLIYSSKPYIIRTNAPGGTGKSYTILTSIYYVDKTVIWLSPTNAALNVIKNLVSDLNIKTNIHFFTIASFFNWGKDCDASDKEYNIFGCPKIQIGQDTIIIIDEISMCGGIYYELINHYLINKCKLILIGDQCQIQSVITPAKKYVSFKIENKKEVDSIELSGGSYYGYVFDKEIISKLFKIKVDSDIHLKSIMRTNNSYISKINETFRDNILNNKQLDSGLFNSFVNKDDSNIIVKNSSDYFTSANRRYPVPNNEMLKYSYDNDCIIIAAYNVVIDEINKRCQKLMYPNSVDRFNVGERIIINSGIFKDSFYLTAGEIHHISKIDKVVKTLPKKFIYEDLNKLEDTIDTNEEFKVNLYKITLRITPDIKQYPILYVPITDQDKITLKDWRNFWTKKIKEKFKKKTEKEIRRILFRKKNSIYSYYNDDIKLAYGISTHKCQGNTYKEVIIVLSNLLMWPDYVSRKNLIYTAISRASNKIILDVKM
jgi:hypothetical protein